MAEELRLHQLVGDGGAVDRDEPRPRRADQRWMSRAVSSLPVPVSPMSSTGITVRAARRALAQKLRGCGGWR